MNLHEDMPKEVNKVFVRHPLDLEGGELDPPKPQDLQGILDGQR